MKWNLIFAAVLVIFSFSSCIEILDDLTLNNDGSGTFKYSINLSSSKVKVNSVLALDSLDGKKVPTIDEISAKIKAVVNDLKESNGISNVQMESNYTDFIFKLQFDFTSVKTLQEAILAIVKAETKNSNIKEIESRWLTFEDGKLVRSIPQITVEKANQFKKEDADLLKAGSYTSITRFEREIESFENPEAKQAKNNKAMMLRTNAYSLTQNPSILDNTIYLVKEE
jgi:hypothetical protein